MNVGNRQTERHPHVVPASAVLQQGMSMTSCGLGGNWYSRSLDNPRINSGKTSAETWKSAAGGKSHAGVQMSFAAGFPDMHATMKREERDIRALIGSDQCVIDQQWFFLRGCLEVPILGREEPFVWGLWVSVKEQVYDEVSDFWTLEGREKLHGRPKGAACRHHPRWKTNIMTKKKLTSYAITQPNRFHSRFDFGHHAQNVYPASREFGTMTNICSHAGHSV
jgi:hypothetical protein